MEIVALGNGLGAANGPWYLSQKESKHSQLSGDVKIWMKMSVESHGLAVWIDVNRWEPHGMWFCNYYSE